MVKVRKSIKFFILAAIIVFSLACNRNSELAKLESSEKSTEISSPLIGLEINGDIGEFSTDETFFVFSEAKARYLITEQLAKLNFPVDAIGETTKVSGNIVIDSDGVVKKESSNIIVDLASLKSDEAKRDRYLSRNSLETSKFPEARFIIEEIKGLKWPIERNNGMEEIELVGHMTIHGETKPLNWDVKLSFSDDNTIDGLAKTEFSFSYFNIAIPKLAFILSVEDRIRLEFEFVVESKKQD